MVDMCLPHIGLQIFKRVHWVADKFEQIGNMSAGRLVASGALKCQYEAAGIHPPSQIQAFSLFKDNSSQISLQSVEPGRKITRKLTFRFAW